jgi:hypothetical protein
MCIISMESTLKELRKFIVKEIISNESKWSTEGRTEYYSTKYVSIKKNFDTGLWQFKLNGGVDKFFDFNSIGINKYFVYILFFFIKRNINKQTNIRKNESLISSWVYFLNNNNNKDIKRDEKINKGLTLFKF